MNKTTIVILAILTALVLVTLGGVAYGAQARSVPAENVQALPVNTLNPAAQPSGQTTAALSPQEIADRAAQAIGRTDVYSIESVLQNGEMEYRVTFSSGDVVRLDAAGQVIGIDSPPASTGAGWDEDDDGDEYEEHDEHEDHEEQDDREDHDSFENGADG